MAAGPAAGIQGPATVSWQLRDQPIPEALLLEPGEAIVIPSESIE